MLRESSLKRSTCLIGNSIMMLCRISHAKGNSAVGFYNKGSLMHFGKLSNRQDWKNVFPCRILVVLCLSLLGANASGAGFDSAASCETLRSLTLPEGAITSAQHVRAGQFVPPAPGSSGNKPPQVSFKDLPAFCRVTATLKPSSDSDIRIEVWLPESGWNGKLLGVGNGGWGGTIPYPAMADGLSRGYAAGSTDMGHAGAGASFAPGHPERVIDFGYRSVHEMTTRAKEIVNAFYGNAPKFSYWDGCSVGGRQGLKEAQMFPADYDGIIAGSPAADHTGRAAQALRVAQALANNEAARLSPAKSRLVHEAVLAACDTLDGVRDGLIDNPKLCKFDPGLLQCKAADDGSCLTHAQVETVRMMYTPSLNPKTRREIGALEPGSELGWTELGWSEGARYNAYEHFRFIVSQDPNFDLRKFDFARDITRAEEIDNGTINALNTNLKPFFGHGGKLVQYHGWTDPQISPDASVQYYTGVQNAMGGARDLERSYRLFMIPGMNHCGGGDGANTFDMLTALEQWVEKGKAPEQVIASHSTNGKVDRTRPLCPYPQVAKYKGAGSTDDATNFVCKSP